MTDLTKSSFEQLFGLLKAVNTLDSKIKPTDIELVTVGALTAHSTGKNTFGVIKGKAGGRLLGDVYIYYNRMSLALLATRTKNTLTIKQTSTEYDILQSFNVLYRCKLDTNDVSVNVFRIGNSARRSIQLIAKSGSMAWIGEINIAARVN